MKKEIEVGKESAEVFEAIAKLVKAGKKGGVEEMMKELSLLPFREMKLSFLMLPVTVMLLRMK